MSIQAKLRDLFLLDQQVRGLRGRSETALRHQKLQQTRLDRLLAQRNETAEQHKLIQAKASGFEHQARDVEDRIAHLREQMNSVKNNKEYSALLMEVSTLKNDKSKVEDQALELMGKVEQITADLKQLDEKVAQQQKLVASAETEVNASRAEVAQQLAEVSARREQAEQELPLETRQLFAKLADMHEGEAMAPVIEESRRHLEYSCGGCYMSIPVERVNALTTRDDVVVCPNCNRILYLDQELKASMVRK